MAGIFDQNFMKPFGSQGTQTPSAAPAAPAIRPKNVGVMAPSRGVALGSRTVPQAAPAQSVAPVAHIPGTGYASDLKPTNAQMPQQAALSAAAPYHVAQNQMFNRQANQATAAGGHTVGTYGATGADQQMLAQHQAERLDLFKQYHGGLSPGEFQAAQRGAVQSAPGYDPFRDQLSQQAAHPQYQQRGATAVYQGGFSPMENQERGAEAGQRLAAYDVAQAQAAKENPFTQVEVARRLAADRPAAGAMIAINRGDPTQANNIPVAAEGGEEEHGRTPSGDLFGGTSQPGESTNAVAHQPSSNVINPGNYREILSQYPQYRELAEALAPESKNDIHEEAHLFANTPGAADPSSIIQRVWDAHMAAMSAEDPRAFQQELGQYNPGSPGHGAIHTGGLGYISRMLGLDQATTARNQQMARDMATLGYGPARANVQPTLGDQISARLFGRIRPGLTPVGE